MFDLSDKDKDKILDEAGIRATQKSVACVYAMAGELGYTNKYVHDELRPSHMTKEEISALIEQLKEELDDRRGDDDYEFNQNKRCRR